MDDQYYTIAKPASAEIKVKGSRFIGRASVVERTAGAIEQLTAVRKKEHAATHHCYAWRVGMNDEIAFKYSDDGEPGGTAGRPIYDTITGRDLTNIIIIVTRYYGGTKLGTGGLVRAYSDTAVATLTEAGLQEHFLTDILKVTTEFSWYDQITRLTNRLGAKQVAADFSDLVRLELEIRQSQSESFRAQLIELTGGKIEIE